VNAVFLVVIGLFVFLEAVHRIMRPPELNRHVSLSDSVSLFATLCLLVSVSLSVVLRHVSPCLTVV
jgi:Co/Zn/Cd efflux system component